MRVSLFPDRDPGGRIGGAFAVMTDIEDDVRIRDALKAQEVQLRLFADNIPGPIAYLDRSLRYTFVNQAFANWVCKPQDEIYGKSPNEVLKSDVASFLRPILKRAQFGEHVEYERIGKNANGDRRWMHGRVAPDLDSTGKVRGLYCTEYDIHDLKSTEQALAAREEQLRLFTDNIPEPVVYLDARPQATRSSTNRSCSSTASIRDEVIGKPSEEVIGLEASQALAPFHDRAFAGETLIYERALVDANGPHALDPRPDGARPRVRRPHPGRLRRQPRHHRPEGSAGRARGARIAAARHHGRRAGAGRLHRPRRALPLRQPDVPAVFRPDRRAGRASCACATSSATASTRARRRCCRARSRARRPRSTGWCRARTACAAG